MLCLVGVSNEFSGWVWELGSSLGLPLYFCVCSVCCFMGGADLLFAVSCQLVVWFSSVDCSSCVLSQIMS